MKFEELKQALVAAAERQGLKEYEIYYQAEESISAETLKQEISSFSSSNTGGICFRCIVDGKMGYASGELMTEEAMGEMVANAISNARAIDSEDEVFIFAGSSAYAPLPEREVKLIDPAAVRDTALKLQADHYAICDKVADGTQSAAVGAVSEIHLCNSKGLDLSNRVGVSFAYSSVVVREGEEAQESFEYAVGESYDDVKAMPAKAVQSALDNAGMVVNKNTIPYDTESPFKTSGIRVGTASITTRGMKEAEAAKIGGWIADILSDITNVELQQKVKAEAAKLVAGFPVP